MAANGESRQANGSWRGFTREEWACASAMHRGANLGYPGQARAIDERRSAVRAGFSSRSYFRTGRNGPRRFAACVQGRIPKRGIHRPRRDKGNSETPQKGTLHFTHGEMACRNALLFTVGLQVTSTSTVISCGTSQARFEGLQVPRPTRRSSAGRSAYE